MQGGAGGRRGKEIPGDTHSRTLTSAPPPPGVPTPYKSHKVYLKIQECNRVRKVGPSSSDSTMIELNHRSHSKPGGDPQKSQLPWIPSQPQESVIYIWCPNPTPTPNPAPPRSMELPGSGHSCWECPLHLQESTPIFRGSSP